MEKTQQKCHFYEGESPMIGGYDEYVLACPINLLARFFEVKLC